MRFSKLLIYTLMIAIIIACDKEEDCCTNIDVELPLTFANAIGDNLVADNTIQAERINLFRMFDGVKQPPQVISVREILPRLEKAETEQDTFFLLYPHIVEGENESIILMEYRNNMVSDTLKLHFNRSQNSLKLDKVYVNNGSEAHKREDGILIIVK